MQSGQSVNISQDSLQDHLLLTEKLRDLLNTLNEESVDAAMNLVRAGANPDAVNKQGSSLLHLLAMNDNEGCYHDLIEELVVGYHADLNILDKKNHTPIRLCNRTRLDTIRQLIRLGAKDGGGNSLLPLLKDKDLTYEKIILTYHVHQPYLIDISLFQKKNHVGSGSFANVYRYQNISNGRNVVIKEIDRDDTTNFLSRRFESEARIMRRLTEENAENVIRFFGFNLDTGAYQIVMEYASCGSLMDYMDNYAPSNDKKNAFVCGTINGLKHIHHYQILHCDFKCQNILVDEMLQIKIADFGSSIYKDSGKETFTTCTYCPPEIEGFSSAYTEKSDIFSLGIVMWEITNWIHSIYTHLFSGKSEAAVRGYYQSGKRPDLSYIPTGYASLIRRCWDQDPAKRPMAEEAQKELHENQLCKCGMTV